jgi:hypothetical protein
VLPPPPLPVKTPSTRPRSARYRVPRRPALPHAPPPPVRHRLGHPFNSGERPHLLRCRHAPPPPSLSFLAPSTASVTIPLTLGTVLHSYGASLLVKP